MIGSNRSLQVLLGQIVSKVQRYDEGWGDRIVPDHRQVRLVNLGVHLLCRETISHGQFQILATDENAKRKMSEINVIYTCVCIGNYKTM